MTRPAFVSCPACQAMNAAPGAGASDTPCQMCQAPLLVGGRYALLKVRPGEPGADAADGAAPLWSGYDVETDRPVLLRLARLGASPSLDDEAEQRERLEREAVVLRGLSHPRLPRLLDEVQADAVGRVLVLSTPRGPSLEEALDGGLRTDSAGGQRFLIGLLEVLAWLHGRSPPVYHRFVQPHAVFLDGDDVSLYDFARATDRVADAVTDPVLQRTGYAPTGPCDPVALDLFGAAATCVHLLTRTPLEELPHDEDGRPLFRQAANVEDRLARVLERLLDATGRHRFGSAEEALAALREPVRPPDVEPVPARRVAVAAGVALAVVAGGAAGFLSFSAQAPDVGPPSTPPAAAAVPSVPAQRTTSQVPPPRRAVTEPVNPAADEPTPPPATTSSPSGGRRAPPPAPADDGSAVLKSLQAAIAKREADLVACAGEADDRFRFEVELGLDGRVAKVTPRDRRHATAVQCLTSVLDGLAAKKPRARAVTAEVTLYLRPHFRVTVF